MFVIKNSNQGWQNIAAAREPYWVFDTTGGSIKWVFGREGEYEMEFTEML